MSPTSFKAATRSSIISKGQIKHYKERNVKKKTKKLSLDIETIRHLDDPQQLKDVDGGGCTGWKCPTAGVTECCCEEH